MRFSHVVVSSFIGAGLAVGALAGTASAVSFVNAPATAATAPASRPADPAANRAAKLRFELAANLVSKPATRAISAPLGNTHAGTVVVVAKQHILITTKTSKFAAKLTSSTKVYNDSRERISVKRLHAGERVTITAVLNPILMPMYCTPSGCPYVGDDFRATKVVIHSRVTISSAPVRKH